MSGLRRDSPLGMATILFYSVMTPEYERRQNWMIWAAKARQCPVCGEPPFNPCLNMSQLRRMPSNRIPTRNPHSERIDPERLIYGLLFRGYISSEVHDATLLKMRQCD